MFVVEAAVGLVEELGEVLVFLADGSRPSLGCPS